MNIRQLERCGYADLEDTEKALRIYFECQRFGRALPHWLVPVLCKKPTYPVARAENFTNQKRNKYHVYYHRKSYGRSYTLISCRIHAEHLIGARYIKEEITTTKDICKRCLKRNDDFLKFMTFNPVMMRSLDGIDLSKFTLWTRNKSSSGEKIDPVIVRLPEVKDSLAKLIKVKYLNPYGPITKMREIREYRDRFMKSWD